MGEEHVGKNLRCKQCGKSTPIVAAPSDESGIDIYGLNDDLPTAPVATEPVLARARVSAGTAEKGQEGKAKKSKGVRLLEAIPGKDDAIFPILGVGSLVMTGIMVVIGGLPAIIWFLFALLATPACLIWAGVAALKAAKDRETKAFWPLLEAVLGGLLFCILFLFGGPNKTFPVFTAIAALGGLVAFVSAEKRFQTYARPVALGIFGGFLFLSLSIMVNLTRQRLAQAGLTNQPIPQASALPPPRPGGVTVVKSSTGDGPASAFPLVQARRSFATVLTRTQSPNQPAPEPPPLVFTKVVYKAPLGSFPAYLTPAPAGGGKHPAIIWITGGDCNTIDEVWTDADPSNDQTAAAYRKAGIVMMFPSLRGGNTNPGPKEGFLGEVEDILAAADFLAKQEYVDPSRIYLGGHSTGGTLVMLVAASTDRFRAVFAFGPVHNVAVYPGEFTPFNTSDRKEVEIRSPGFWLNAIRCPTFVIEGTTGNILPLRAMERSSSNPLLHFTVVDGKDHFSVLSPTNQAIAGKILQDTGPALNISLN